MKTKANNFTRASALRITFSITLIFVSAILLATARVATPILGNYPDTTLALSTDTTVTPDAPPTNTTSINVSTSTDFNGTLAGDPTTGVVRVTDAHPAGTYTVTVTAFDSGGATATKTFTLTVTTTPVTCNLSFAAAANFAAGDVPRSVAVGDFNGDGKQDLAIANITSNNVSILLGHGTGHFSASTDFPAQFSLVSSGGRFQWRRETRPRYGQLPLKQRVDLVGRWHGQLRRSHKLRRWR